MALSVLTEGERLTTSAERAMAEIDRMVGADGGLTPAVYGRRLEVAQDPIDAWKAFLEANQAELTRQMFAAPTRGAPLAQRFELLFTRIEAAGQWLGQEPVDA